jgi:predicted DNA-binding transcriptional regulator YafY
VGDRNKRVKEFALQRIIEAKVLDSIRDVPIGFDLNQFIHEQQGFGFLVQGEPGDIPLVLEVGPVLRFTLSETALSADQHIEKLAEDRFRVTATVKNTHQLRAWIREKGTQALVISPEYLRQDLVDQYNKLIQQYQCIS